MNFSNLKSKFNSKQAKTWLYSSLAVAGLVGLGVAGFTIFEGNSMVAEAFIFGNNNCNPGGGITGQLLDVDVVNNNGKQDKLVAKGWAVRQSEPTKKAYVELRIIGINGTNYQKTTTPRAASRNIDKFYSNRNIERIERDNDCPTNYGFEITENNLPVGNYRIEAWKNDEERYPRRNGDSGGTVEKLDGGKDIRIENSRNNNSSRNEPKKSDDYSSNRNNSGISNVERLQQVKQEAGGSQFELYYSGTIRDASGNRIPNKDNITLTRINGRRNSDLGKLVQLHADSFNTSAGSKTHMQILRDSGTIYQNQNGNWWMDLDKLASGIQM